MATLARVNFARLKRLRNSPKKALAPDVPEIIIADHPKKTLPLKGDQEDFIKEKNRKNFANLY